MHDAGSRWDVVGVGAACIDLVCRLPVFPEAGTARSKVLVTDQHRACGGQTATALATCARLGLRASFVGAVGDDDDGAAILAALSSRGIATEHVRVVACPTATAILLIDESGERLVLWHRHRDLVMDPGARLEGVIGESRLLHVDDVDEAAAIRAARLAREAGIPITCDIDHVTARTSELLSLVTHPILAEHVPTALTGEADIGAALRAMSRTHSGPIVATLGPRGAVALVDGVVITAPGFPAEAVDTTGAGDVFRGAFIVALLGGQPLQDALGYANAAAAVSCTRLGAMAGVPTVEDIDAVLATRRPRT